MILVLAVVIFLSGTVASAEILTIKQALGSATAHPATKKPITRSNYQQLTYLNCHDLAFNANNKSNSWENLPLYDFIEPESVQELEILRRFFDVLLADLAFAANNEHMATAFINMDRAQVRSELGQYSEIEVLALQSAYQTVRVARFASEKKQRLTRVKLAEAMGDIDQAVADLQEPYLRPEKFVIPEYEALVTKALKANQLAKSAIQTMRLKQRLLNLILRLEMLALAKEDAAALATYRDVYLDRSRALYEMEVKSDLGDSMVWQSRALMQETTVDFCIALTYAEINALQNEPVWPISYYEN